MFIQLTQTMIIIIRLYVIRTHFAAQQTNHRSI